MLPYARLVNSLLLDDRQLRIGGGILKVPVLFNKLIAEVKVRILNGFLRGRKHCRARWTNKQKRVRFDVAMFAFANSIRFCAAPMLARAVLSVSIALEIESEAASASILVVMLVVSSPRASALIEPSETVISSAVGLVPVPTL